MTPLETYLYIKEHINEQDICVNAIEQEYGIQRLIGAVSSNTINGRIDEKYPVRNVDKRPDTLEGQRINIPPNLNPENIFTPEQVIAEL